MYAAKQAGRNRYHLFDAEHDREARAHREALGSHRATALAAGEFVLHYQPKVNMRDGQRDRRRGADPLAASASAACCRRPTSCR